MTRAETEAMILDGSRGWYWYLKSLPEKVREWDGSVRFTIVEREIGDRLCAGVLSGATAAVVGVIAYDILDADTLLGILFDESLKSKCIAAIDEDWHPMLSTMDITIVLVQGGKGYTNIDADVMESFAKVLET